NEWNQWIVSLGFFSCVVVSYLGSQSSVVAFVCSWDCKGLGDAIEEFSMVFKEVVRIKDILLDKDIELHGFE
ncbi:unnamed protein product, partial [Brassica oleracea var. botrytis]